MWKGGGGGQNLKSWGVGYVGGLHEIGGEETCASYDIKRSFEVMQIQTCLKPYCLSVIEAINATFLFLFFLLFLLIYIYILPKNSIFRLKLY